jgi:cell division protease FtsH
MVRRYGMSERLGPMSFGAESESVFLGRELLHSRDYSDETAAEIDAEVRRMMQEALDRAKQAIAENRLYLDELAVKLLEVETLRRDEIQALLAGVQRGRLPVSAGAQPSGDGATAPPVDTPVAD